jgi:predicted mannosyl-3-phosphoglycerate phosphatase (HAD superfamily)
MQHTDYGNLENFERYVVHHHDDRTGMAIFTIVQYSKRKAEVAEMIETVQFNAMLLMASGATEIQIGDVYFELNGIISILHDIALERLTVMIDRNGKVLNLEQIVELEDTVQRFVTGTKDDVPTRS